MFRDFKNHNIGGRQSPRSLASLRGNMIFDGAGEDEDFGRRAIQSAEHRLPNRLIAEAVASGGGTTPPNAVVKLGQTGVHRSPGSGEPGHFDQFGGRYESLSLQQMLDHRVVWGKGSSAFWRR